MKTCETCGASFEPKQGVEEVVSLRILCPSCAAARAAAKKRKLEPAAPALAKPGGDGAAPRKPLHPAAPPHAPKHAPQASKPAAPAPKPVARAEAPPARPPVPAARVVRGGEPAPAKPAPRPARRTADADLHPVHDAEEIALRLRRKNRREMILSFAVAFVVFAVAGAVLWKVLGQKKAEEQVRQAALARIEDFRTTFMAYDIQDEAAAKEMIAYSDEHKELWGELDFAPEVVSRVAKAKTFLEGVELRRDLLQRLESIEAGMAKAAEISPSELAELRRRLDELAARAEIGGAEFVARVATDRKEAEKVFVERLLTSAAAAAAAEPMDRSSIATIQLAEDEVFKLLDATAKAVKKNSQDAELVAKQKEYEKHYQSVIKLSDEAVQRFFTPEVIEAVSWRDLLAPDQAAGWKSDIAKGYSRQIENGVLRLIGPDPTEKTEIVMSVGDKEIWRDFEIDMEFTIEKGMFTTYWRMPIVYQGNEYYYDLTTEEGQLSAGQPYHYTFRILGSTFIDEQHSEDSPGPSINNISWTKPRKGGFGIGVSKDTEIKFTRLRARVLR